jgi:hypothetical protein
VNRLSGNIPFPLHKSNKPINQLSNLDTDPTLEYIGNLTCPMIEIPQNILSSMRVRARSLVENGLVVKESDESYEYYGMLIGNWYINDGHGFGDLLIYRRLK